MPIYEYQAEDGTVVELIRPMADADKPVADPEGKHRTFARRLSAFAAQGGTARAGGASGGGCCPCGKNAGGCGGGGRQ
ncbi:MAG: zinc ribbon domain-containing protein [Phycisphaerales bacterium]